LSSTLLLHKVRSSERLTKKSFALQRVSICTSLCSLSFTKATRQQTKIGAKIGVKKPRKIAPKDPLGDLNRSQIHPKINFGATEAPKKLRSTIRGVPDAPRERPGGDRRDPKNAPMKKGDTFGVPRNVRKRTETINLDVHSAPESKQSTFFCAVGSRRHVETISRRFPSISTFFLQKK